MNYVQKASTLTKNILKNGPGKYKKVDFHFVKVDFHFVKVKTLTANVNSKITDKQRYLSVISK